MKNFALFLFVTVALGVLTGCNPSVHTHIVKTVAPLDAGQEVKVITKEQALPAGAEFIGVVTVDESGFTTNCSYDYVIYLAITKARAAGANLIKITTHRTPDFWSTCHSIEANMYAVSKRFPAEDDDVGYWNDEQSESKPARKDTVPGDSSVESQAVSPYFSDVIMPEGSGPNAVAGFEPVRMSLLGASSRRLAPLPEDLPSSMRQYLDELRSGFTFAIDIGFKLGGGSYLGPQYTRFRTSNSMLVAFDSPDNSPSSGEMRETITISFIGLQWTNRYAMANSRSGYYLSTALGYTSFFDSGIYPFEVEPEKYALFPYTLKGGNIGYRLEGGLDLRLSDQISLALGMGFSTGTIYKLTLDVGGSTSTIELDRNQGEGLIRMDLLTGLRWHF